MSESGRGAKRVLVVDDEPHIREIAQMTLEAVAGWRVATASSGADALAMLDELVPDAILLDVMMPGMDGPTTVQRLRAKAATEAVPVILLTAKVQADDRRRFDDLDIQGVISKPFDPMRLAAEIAATLDWEP